jgi:hypothetical protein
MSIHGADSTSSPSSGYIQIDSIIHDDDSTWHVFFQKSSFIVYSFVGLAYCQGKDTVFRFIIEYSSLMDFGP